MKDNKILLDGLKQANEIIVKALKDSGYEDEVKEKGCVNYKPLDPLVEGGPILIYGFPDKEVIGEEKINFSFKIGKRK